MKKIYIQILIFLCFAVLFSSKIVMAQTQQKDKNKITIESVVKDEKGNPIKGAMIYGNEGTISAKTDASGKFTISIPDQTDILIESAGYESVIFKAGEIKNMKEFPLKASLFMYGSKDEVNIAFKKIKRGDLADAVTVINPDDILQYDNNLNILSAITGRVPGLLGSSNLRGMGAPLFIVDGLPRDISTINMSEIAQISILKDANSSVLYGNGGVTGVIQLTTKRGQAGKKDVKVQAFYGISKPTALPKFLSSANYEQLYNEALVNDGLLPQYDAATIANYQTGNPYRYPSVDYYSSQYLNKIKPFSKVQMEMSGGNEVATYYSNIGWQQVGSLINFGAGDNAPQNLFNARGNVDLKVNSWIKTSLDGVAVFNNSKGSVTGTSGTYWAAANTLKPNLLAPLLPISLMKNQIDPLILSRKNDVNGLYMLGGTQVIPTDPIADGYSGGYNVNIIRNFSFNNRIDFDLNKFVEGLAFHTNVSFDFYTRFDQAVNNTYAIYQPTWSATADSITSLKTYGLDSRSGTQNITNGYYERRFGFYGMLDYDRTFGGVHHISGSLLGYGYRFRKLNDIQGSKNANLGLRLAYSFKNKYLVDFSSSYTASVKLPKSTRYGFSPTLGLAWVISSEDFMSSVSAINYLKLRLSGGIINSDNQIGGYFYYDNRYTNSGSYNWYEGSFSNSGVISSYGGNSSLSFPKRKELNLGFESMLFNNLISVDANYFTSQYSGQLATPTSTYPSFYLNYIPYQNFTNYAYKGAELGLSINKSFGDLSLVIGVNVLYADSKVLKTDEIYTNAYQYRKGQPVDALFGLVSNGFFADQNDINNSPIQRFGIIKPGDIKYVDQDGNGIIDANDQVKIGRYQPPFTYAPNLKISYKGFTLFALGNGRIGANSYTNASYYWVQGTVKYSEFILNRWTPATATTATYPRLSSQNNSNNFQNSTFWLYRDNYFTLDRMQLSYDMPEAIARKLLMKKLSVYVDGSWLFTISKQRTIKETNVYGTEPYYRSYSLGIKTMF